MASEKKFVIAGIGEVLWDVLEDGEKLGGAPINFAYHAGMLGAEAYAVSTVGDDDRGRRAMTELEQSGVSVEHISVMMGATTGYVEASVDENGIASYLFPNDVAWDHLQVGEATKDLAGRLDAVCFGSLAQRAGASREAIMSFLEIMPQRSLKVFDLNVRQRFYTPEIIRVSLGVADVLKLNDDEINLIADIERLSGSETGETRAIGGKVQTEARSADPGQKR